MIHRKIFGEVTVGEYHETIYCYTLDNGFMTVGILNYGSTVSSIKLPDKTGKKADVVLGFSNLKGYQDDCNPCFGDTVGRVCNKIANDSFNLGGKNYKLSAIFPPITVHGGFMQGLDSKIWGVDICDSNLILTCISYHREEGFPGTVEFRVIYELTSDNELMLKMRAKTTHPTPINLTNSSYFNLAGHDTGWTGIRDHEIRINADRYTPVDQKQIPTGEIFPVSGSDYDLRSRKNLGQIIRRSPAYGYDVNYCVNGSINQMRFVARTHHRKSGRILEVHSDQPGVRFYTGGHLSNIPGKKGAVYNQFAGFSFQTQNYPNAVNIPSFPNSILLPHAEYTHNVTYKFFVDST